MTMLKKLKLNIEYINSKTKKYYKYNLTNLPKKKNYLKLSGLRVRNITRKVIE